MKTTSIQWRGCRLSRLPRLVHARTDGRTNTIGPISTLVNVNTIKISRSERAATIQLAGANVGLIKETLIACCQQHGIR